MIDWWGPVITEYYGGTETGVRDLPHRRGGAAQARAPSAGHCAGATMRIYDDAGAAICRPVRSAKFTCWLQGVPDFTYHGLPEKRREIERDGLISIGDVGYLDEDGYLFSCDRKNDMVISGGVNIYPAEIEAALIAMPGVRDCAVFGIPHEEFGETLCAHIEPEPGAVLDEAAIRFVPARAARRFQGAARHSFRHRSAARGFRQDHEAQAARPLLGSHRAPHLEQNSNRIAPLPPIVIAIRGLDPREAISGR